jgi:GNAT superfamily N-acetyltransferase
MITIRPARPEDANTVIALANGLNQYEGKPDTPLTAGRFRENAFSDAPWFECLIAEREGRAVGYAAYCRSFDLESGERGLYLIDLFVVADERRHGVGRELMANLARVALDLACAYLEWNVTGWNTESQSFYRAIGGIEEEVATFSMELATIRRLANGKA